MYTNRMKYLNFKFILVSIIISFTISCKINSNDFINHIEGYWEIESVTLKDGTKKDYNYNNTIDFILITDSLTGFRKKLKPNFQGTFETSNQAETFVIKIENDSLNVYYKTAFDNWKETILLATDKHLQVINKNHIIYTYKRYEPLNLE